MRALTSRQLPRRYPKSGAAKAVEGSTPLMLDRDAEGEMGARQALVEIAQKCSVRLAWSSEMHGGASRAASRNR